MVILLRYDPYFFPNRDVLTRTYDFITLTEVAEHFYHPYEEFSFLGSLLSSGGILVVMTSFLPNTKGFDFADWYYRRDPTHVVFYTEKTMKDIAKRNNWTCSFPRKNVTLFQKL
eukprot:TRINITY_DN2205_c0_g1_i2.p1 TRINITY_DN2205_c0_g1~~TRINITY_DN2205_c0_g1_i2.p1  ORF type:complete len:114 (-),score=12.08 TRINITY_DN2205_c0_g1_i2:96-437(-)